MINLLLNNFYRFHKVQFSIVPLGLIINEFVYADNGNWIENEESDYFGTSLIDIFSEQLEGKYNLFKNKGQTKYVFEFKNESVKS